MQVFGQESVNFLSFASEMLFFSDTISANERSYVERMELLCGFEFHGDDGTEEGREGVVTAALGLGGVGIVVR